MNKKVKKIIAREGLIFLGIIVFSVLLMVIPTIYLKVGNFIPSTSIWTQGLRIAENISYFGMGLLVWGYPACLLIRFIIWAIRTLRQKD